MVGTPSSDHESNKIFDEQRKHRSESGEPDRTTRLGDQQARRMATRSRPDSLQTPGFTRWDKT